MGESAAITKNAFAIFTILFLIEYIYYLGAVCLRKSFEPIKQIWRCGFEHGLKYNSEFRPFAGCLWFRKISCDGRFWALWVTQSRATQIGLDSDQWWWRCHLHTCSKNITILTVWKIYQWYWFLQHLSGGHNCYDEEHLPLQEISASPSKSSKFWFWFVSTFKVTSSKLFDWF